MPMSDEDFAVFSAHTNAYRQDPCPVCRFTKWQADGPVAPMVYESLSVLLPMALLICGNCYFVRQFAWLPIKEAAERAQAHVVEAEGAKP